MKCWQCCHCWCPCFDSYFWYRRCRCNQCYPCSGPELICDVSDLSYVPGLLYVGINTYGMIGYVELTNMAISTTLALLRLLNQSNTLKWDRAHYDYCKDQKEHSILHINIISYVLQLNVYGKNKAGHYLHPSPEVSFCCGHSFIKTEPTPKNATCNRQPTLVYCWVVLPASSSSTGVRRA